MMSGTLFLGFLLIYLFFLIYVKDHENLQNYAGKCQTIGKYIQYAFNKAKQKRGLVRCKC